MLAVFFLFLQICFVVYLLYYIIAFVSGAPFVPSTNPTAQSMIKLAQIKKGDIVYDLGSGDGKLLFRAASEGAIARGIEINPLLVLYTEIRALLTGKYHQVTATWQSFWKTDLKDADVVFIYLLPWRMEKLEARLKKQLKKGTVIVSNSFMFPHLTLLRQDPKNHVFVYKI